MSVLSVPLLLQLAAACPAQGVPDQRIVATARVESGFQTTALHDNTSRRSYSPATPEEAVALARSLLAQGHSLDAGAMQVNDKNWGRLGLTVETAFDPALNVCAGKRVLAEAEVIARRAAACVYNTGKPVCSNDYPDKIEAAMRAPVAPAPAPVPVTVVAAPAVPPNRPPAWDVYAAASRRTPAQTAPVQLSAR